MYVSTKYHKKIAQAEIGLVKPEKNNKCQLI